MDNSIQHLHGGQDMNRKHYEDLISYHKELLAEAEKYNQVEAAAYQRGMIEAYTRVLNTTRG